MTQDSATAVEWPSPERSADYVGRHHLSHWWQWRNPTGQPFRINRVGPQERPSREPSLIGSTLKGGAFK